MNKLIVKDSKTGTVTEYNLDIEKSPLDGVTITVVGKNNTISIETPFHFQRSSIFIRTNNVLIDAKKSTSNWPIVLNISIRNGEGQRLFIGENFTSGGTNIEMLQPNCQCIIGDDCMFSSNIQFLAADGHCIFDNENKLINWSSGIEIGNHVWIGKNATVLKNTRIANNSIVGANAVVTSKIDDENVALAGSPAKIVKKGIRWERTALEKWNHSSLQQGDTMNKIFLIQNGEKKEISLHDLCDFYPRLNVNFSGIGNVIELHNNIKFSQQASLNINVLGNTNRVEIGSECIFNRNTSIVFQGGGPGAKADNCTCKIGDNCNFNGANISFILGEKNTNISVGNDCLFAQNITMTTTDNHTIYDIDSQERVNLPGDIHIGNHVWIAREVLILNNSLIKDNCVVASRAVVTKKFEEENIVVGGVPSKIIKRNTNWKFRLD